MPGASWRCARCDTPATCQGLRRCRLRRGLSVLQRIRALLDERRWRDYTRVPGSPAIYYRAPICAAFLALATPAQADPCKAIPDSGSLPSYLRPGMVFSGPVTYVADGDGLCVALGRDPRQWVEVRLGDFYAPELNEAGGQAAKAALDRVVGGRQVTCISSGRRTWDRVVAVCRRNGVALGDLMRRAGVREGGRGWKP